jgi:hypothetical protein
MSVYSTLLSRFPDEIATGKNAVIRNTLAAGMETQTAIAAANDRKDLAPLGRANMIAQHVKLLAGPALTKSRRQFEWHAKAIEKQTAALTKLVLGAHDPLDAERRQILRGMSAADSAKAVTTDSDFRMAALRGGRGLTNLPGEVFERAMEMATAERAAPQAAALAAAKEAQDLHGAAIEVLENELLDAVALGDPNSGTARRFASKPELEKYLAAEVKVPVLPVLAQEEAQADAA